MVASSAPIRWRPRRANNYLICNSDKYDDAANYRLDRICDLALLEERARPFETLKGADGRPWICRII